MGGAQIRGKDFDTVAQVQDKETDPGQGQVVWVENRAEGEIDEAVEFHLPPTHSTPLPRNQAWMAQTHSGGNNDDS